MFITVCGHVYIMQPPKTPKPSIIDYKTSVSEDYFNPNLGHRHNLYAFPSNECLNQDLDSAGLVPKPAYLPT